MQREIVDKGKQRAVEVEDELPADPPPDPAVDYRGWIKAMKPVWRKRRKEISAAHASGAARTGGSRGIASMMQRQTSSLMSDSWDLVQLIPSEQRAGQFKAWLLMRGKLQTVNIRVPRIFYINFETLPADADWPEECLVEAISRTLPRAQPALHLFRVTVAEDVFLARKDEFSKLLNRPEVDGVYEMQVPLPVRALLHIGSCCVPAAGASTSKGLATGFELLELKRAPPSLSKRRYLASGQGVRCIYIYHTASGVRHLICLVLPDGRSKVYVVEGSRNSNPAVPNLERYYVEEALPAHRRLLEAEAAENDGVYPQGVFEYPDKLNVEVSFHAAEEAAFRALQRELVAYGGQRQDPTLLVISSSHGQQYIESRVPNAVQNYPVIAITLSRADSPFGQLEWQRKGTQRFVQHYLRVSGVMHDRIDVAGAADVPLGLLPTDSGPFLADVEFARRLSKSDMLLWWSDGARPDLGGRENDANVPVEEVVDPEINRPGAFTNACLEIEMRDLAVDAILQSALVYELEGAEGTSIGFAEASHNLDEYSKGTAHAAVVLGDALMPTQTFAVLKSMLKSWWGEAARGQAHARLMLEHFWRWISSASSKLFDHAVYRFVHGLMRKTFSQCASLASFRLRAGFSSSAQCWPSSSVWGRRSSTAPSASCA